LIEQSLVEAGVPYLGLEASSSVSYGEDRPLKKVKVDVRNSRWASKGQVAYTGGAMNPVTNPGLVHVASRLSFLETLGKVESTLTAQGLTIFARIDHSGEAAKVGMDMRPTQLIIFGSPKAGTPLMLAAPTTAIDLPLKALVWEDTDSRVRVSYNSPEYLKQRHGVPDELMKNIAGVGTLLETAVA